MTTYHKEQLADLKSGLLIAIVPTELNELVQQSALRIQSSESEAFIKALKYEYAFSTVAFCSRDDLSTLKTAPQSLELVDLDGTPVDFNRYSKEDCFLLEVVYGQLDAPADYQVFKKGELKRTAYAENFQTLIENYDLEYDRYRRYIQQILNDNGYWIQTDFFTAPRFKKLDDWEAAILKKDLKNPLNKGGRVYAPSPELSFINDFMYGPSVFSSLAIQRLFAKEKTIGKKTYLYNNTYSVLLNFQITSEQRYSSSIALLSELLEMQHSQLHR